MAASPENANTKTKPKPCTVQLVQVSEDSCAEMYWVFDKQELLSGRSSSSCITPGCVVLDVDCLLDLEVLCIEGILVIGGIGTELARG